MIKQVPQESFAKRIIQRFDFEMLSNDKDGDRNVLELLESLKELKDFGLSNQIKMQDFLMHEHMIKDDAFFWLLFGNYYLACPQPYHFRKQIDDAIRRNDRLKIDLQERVELSNFVYTFYMCEGDFSILKTPKEFTKEVREYVEKYTANDDIKIYRGFLVPDGADVRVGRTNLDNPSSHIQDTGIGFSFTFDKDIALEHASKNSSSALLLKIFGDELIGDDVDKGYKYKSWDEFWTSFQKMDMSDEMIEKCLTINQYEKISQTGKLMNNVNQWIGFDVRPCVATYTVKKDAIVTAFDYMSFEKEIFCFPTDVILERYDFVSWKEHLRKQNEVEDKTGGTQIESHSIMEHETLQSIKTSDVKKGIQTIKHMIRSQDLYLKKISPKHKPEKSTKIKKTKKTGKKFGKNKKKKKKK